MDSTRRRREVVRILRGGAGPARAASAAADTGQAGLAVAWLRGRLGDRVRRVRVLGC